MRFSSLKQPLLFLFLVIFLLQNNEILAGPIGGKHRIVENEESKFLFEGDIDGIDPESILSAADMKHVANNGIRDEEKRWPNGVVPYVLSKEFDGILHVTNFNRRAFMTALSGFKATCIRFVERTDEKDYILVQNGTSCHSYIGRVGKEQIVSINLPVCLETGRIQHELMHALGFYHEQARSDRDDYVDINNANIPEDRKRNFHNYLNTEITAFGEPYDFLSVTHYGKFDFAFNPDIYTIRPKSKYGDVEIGQRIGLSDVDIKKVNAMYKCPSQLSSPDVVQGTCKSAVTPQIQAEETSTITTNIPDNSTENIITTEISNITDDGLGTKMSNVTDDTLVTETSKVTDNTPVKEISSLPVEPIFSDGLNKNCTTPREPNGRYSWRCSWSNPRKKNYRPSELLGEQNSGSRNNANYFSVGNG